MAMDGLLAPRYDYLGRIWKLRYFWLSLVKNDLVNRYKRSFMGIGWSLLRPLAMTFILCTVFGKMFNLDMAEYAPHVLIGMTIWQFFTEALNQGCQCFTVGAAYIRQQPVPLAIFPLRTVLGCTFHMLIALGLALLITLAFRGSVNPLALIGLIPAILVLFLLGWFLAILSGVIHTHFPDTQHLLEIGLQLLFYLSPILYRPEDLQSRARLSWVVEWNPITSILALFRTPIMEGTMPGLLHIGISLLFLAVVGALAILLLRKLERTLIFWI